MHLRSIHGLRSAKRSLLLPLILLLSTIATQANGSESHLSATTSPPILAHRSIAPTSTYRQTTSHGFTILIHPEVLKHPKEAGQLWQELNTQLAAIDRVMPTKPLAELRKVRIWVEWANRENGAAEFHPSAIWLQQHGYNPDKAGNVEISNSRNFVQWSQINQPWMLLHELAHAYHFCVLGEHFAPIEAAYQHALDKHLYASVLYARGPKQKAYALTNPKEYFAELTEAYFGKNDFYPFDRAQLKQYDPIGYQLMEQTWGQPKALTH